MSTKPINMARFPAPKRLMATLLLAFTFESTLHAEQVLDSPKNIEHQRADLSGAENMEVIVSTAEYQPGDAINLHFHHGIEALYVIQGAAVQFAGKPPVQLATGTSLLNQREVTHAGFTVVGDTSLKLFTVHVVDKGKPLYDYAK